MRYFTGVGSRFNVPYSVFERAKKLSRFLIGQGYRCRTGDASDGMDPCFREACLPQCDVYAPRERKHPMPGAIIMSNDIYIQAKQIARYAHPHFDHLGEFERGLHIRNVPQVLGTELNHPSEFLICYTPDGATTKTSKKTGGTGQAIRIANLYHVPVFNLYWDNCEEMLAKHLRYLNWR